MANERILVTFSNPAARAWNAQRVILDTPTKYNINATNVFKLYLTMTDAGSLDSFTIVGAELRPSLTINFLLYMEYDSGVPRTSTVNEETVIIEYFVPA